MARRNKIEVVINAKDNASKVFEDVAGNIQGIGSAALSIGVAGVATATAAMVGLGIVAVNTFSDFEKGMNEVFTLLPDISQAAMDDLEDQLLSFDNAVGRTSEETIPALYQALSAGVDQNTVFEFLELANKAAVGGATDLETAVDGITSVVNAYGEELIDATLASDLMFTAVRLGKTNFEELSASLFNVVPNAAALGVSFGDVTAALATITAQGVPTSVATTQMRQAFVELGDAGSDVSEIFMRISGESFKDFIANGGSVADAMGLLETEAAILGIGVNEMFGSVEAGNAALALTGAAMDTFISNTEEMNNAAGATEGAFDTMNQGIGLAMNRLMATWESTLITIGSVIAPLLTPIIDIFTGFVARISPIVEEIARVFGLVFEINPDSTISGFQLLFTVFEDGSSFLSGIIEMFGVAEADAQSMATAFINGANGIFEALTNVFDIVMSIVQPIINWVAANLELEDVLIAIGLVIASVVLPALLGTLLAIAPIVLGIIALVATVAILRDAWDSDFMGIRTLITDTVLPAIMAFVNWVVDVGFPALVSFIQDTVIPAWDTLMSLLGQLWIILEPIFTSFLDGVMGVFGLIADFFENDAANVWNGLVDLIIRVVARIVQAVQGAINIFNDLIGVAGEAQNIGSGLGSQASQIAASGASFGDIAGAFGNAIFGGRQFGGAVTAGQPVMVGESGRELFVPQQNGTIANNQDTNLGLQENNEGITINFIFNRGISDEEARDSASTLKRELQAQGVNITGA